MQGSLLHKRHLNADLSEERGGAAQPACQTAGRVGPSGGIPAGLGQDGEKLRRRTLPTAVRFHQVANRVGDRVRLDDLVDSAGMALPVGSFEGAVCPQRAFARRYPMGKVGHAGQPRQSLPGQGRQTTGDGVEKGTENLGTLLAERVPQVMFGPPLTLTDCLEGDEDGAVGEVGPADHVLDAVEDNGSGCVEENFVPVGVELAGGKPAAGSEATEGVGEPPGKIGNVVEGEDMSIAGGDK